MHVILRSATTVDPLAGWAEGVRLEQLCESQINFRSRMRRVRTRGCFHFSALGEGAISIKCRTAGVPGGLVGGPRPC